MAKHTADGEGGDSSEPTAVTSVDVAVIGGGLAGLTAAARAATDGASVLVLERGSRLGGRGRSDERDGFVFNQGGHALYSAGAGVEVLADLGITVDGVAPPLDGIGVHSDGNGALPVGPSSMLRSRLLGLREKASFGKVFATLVKADTEALAAVSFGDWVDHAAKQPRTREVLHALARLGTYINAPEIVSAGAIVGQLQAGLSGVLYLNGGWQRLVDQLADVAEGRGAVIRAGSEVTAAANVDGGWRIEAGGAQVLAGAVVVAGLAPVVSARILGLPDTAFAHAGPATEAAVLDLSLDAEPPTRFALGIDVPTYFSVHGPPADMAPPGCASAVAMKYLPVGVRTDVDADRADMDAIVAASGVTAVRDTRFLRAMTVTHGLPLASQGGLAGRPAVMAPGTDSAYVAGDWVGGEGLLADASFASGAEAGRAAAALASRQGAARHRAAAS